MPAPTKTNRTAVKLALQGVLAAAYPTLKVAYGFPGDDWQRETIYVGASRGTFEIHDIRNARKLRDDEFTVDVWFAAGEHGQTPEQADARCEVFVGSLDNALAADMTLGGVAGLKSAQVGDYDGPEPYPFDEGWGSLARVEVVCKSLLQ